MGSDQPKALATDAKDNPRSSQSNILAFVASGAGESQAKILSERDCSEDKNGITDQESSSKTQHECEKPFPDTPSYSRSWFAGFLDDALKTNDVVGSCARAKVTLLDLMRARGADPLIDAAMIEVDEVARMMAINAVVMAAAGGDLRAVKALTDGTLAMLHEGLHPPDRGQLSGQTHHDCVHCGKRFLVIAHVEILNGLKFLQVLSAARTHAHINENPETFPGNPLVPHQDEARP